MTNIFATPEKVSMRDQLQRAGFEALQRQGWVIEREPGIGKSSVRRISRGAESKLVSFKTTQDTALAFSRTPDDEAWSTLEDIEIDSVVIISVDHKDEPRFANVHVVPAKELIARFDRAYDARLKADHIIPVGRGVWLQLYEREASSPVNLVGAGIGLLFPPIAKTPLLTAIAPELVERPMHTVSVRLPDAEAPLTIAEAKRRLALTLGVDPSAIKITVEA